MQMTLEEIRLKQNPVLTNLLLGMGQGTFIGEKVFPRLPQALSKVTIPKVGKERLRAYNLRRAPGSATKRLEIKYEGQNFEVKQYSVDIPLPREAIRESEEANSRFNLAANIDLSRMAMLTASEVLALSYEIEAAEVATNSGLYPVDHVATLSSGTKWSAESGTPVTDISDAAESIRKKTGKRPTALHLSADAWHAMRHNKEVRGYLPTSQMGPATCDQIKNILDLEELNVGDAIWVNWDDEAADVWGNNAVLSYKAKLHGPKGDISLADPAHGFTSVLEGHPFAEKPRYDADTKSWIFGGTYERQVNLAYPEAAFLFRNVK